MHLRQIAAPPLDTTIRPQSRQRHACEGLRIRIWPCTPAPFAGMQHESEPTRFGNPLRFNQTGKGSRVKPDQLDQPRPSADVAVHKSCRPCEILTDRAETRPERIPESGARH